MSELIVGTLGTCKRTDLPKKPPLRLLMMRVIVMTIMRITVMVTMIKMVTMVPMIGINAIK